MSNHIFGPVLSRRLGRSLGIDLLLEKTCSYNCVYCECGATTNLTIRRNEFFPTGDVIAELDDVLKKEPPLDYITFAGSGEPTLSLSIGPVLAYVKDRYPQYRVAVLTNGSLLSVPEVRNDLLAADLVIPTLTTTSQDTFVRIHRPSLSLSVSEILSGMIAFRELFSREIWLEVFLVPPHNTTDQEIHSLNDAIYAIRPDRIQINNLDRPGTESWVRPAPPSLVDSISHFFSTGGIPVDTVVLVPSQSSTRYSSDLLGAVFETLKRRPCTIEDIASMTGFHQNEVRKKLVILEKQGIIASRHGERGIFYYIPTG
ncbi:MAG: radical SAM protein [Methanospirillaceae archaeon]|nr:radical SAM protein [Methanospirillaceae archaeon]